MVFGTSSQAVRIVRACSAGSNLRASGSRSRGAWTAGELDQLVQVHRGGPPPPPVPGHDVRSGRARSSRLVPGRTSKAESRWNRSWTSFSFSSTICSLSAGGR
jgi:hypothetical protein